MDEAGLPEERHESLKVLHYHLDKQVVSFVAITNHVLDAAKTNRAVSLFRPEASDEDLQTLAMGCMCMKKTEEATEVVKSLCSPYSKSMGDRNFSSFFGLRDFMQFLSYLQKNWDKKVFFSSQMVMQALERNFNGHDDFDKICVTFLCAFDKNIKCHENLPRKRHILDVLQESMKDCPSSSINLAENQARYKLIIDPSEDESVVRLLFSFGILVRANTRVFVCSDFPGDGQLQKIDTIAAIRHSAMQGHTVVMSQTDDIHESFYDLFNQRFRRIDDPKDGPRYYANIAIGAHSKPSRVHPKFQCVVVVKKSEIKHTPAPFLNRFEKYLISHRSLLDASLHQLPPCMAILVEAAREKVEKFVEVVDKKSFYGMQDETLHSLILNLLPTLGFKYTGIKEDNFNINCTESVTFFLFQIIINVLGDDAGFHVPKYDDREMKIDSNYIFELAKHNDPHFSNAIAELSHEGARKAVINAFNFLCKANIPDKSQAYHLNTEGYLVIFLLQHLLVRLLTKRMMNLMTTEGFILNHNKIPLTYLENYLENQTHFSLKEAITNYYAALKATIRHPSRNPNKLILYTRSSSLIHTLPAPFPSSPMTMDEQESARKLVFQETVKLKIHKLSSLQSQTSVHEKLADFVNSDTAEVCVLIANMQETTPKTINHVRVMIEEAELQAPDQCCKLFVLLLHFSPVQFFQHCYPVLFLRGWDHCYLDTIAHNYNVEEENVENVVDIYDWLSKCCCPDLDKSDTLENYDALDQLLQQIVPVLSARVYFGNKKDNSFNSAMNATERSKAISVLLYEEGLGDILRERFMAYWNSGTLVKFLKRAATISKERESTLNITDSVQTQFKALFTCFCIYMLTRANEDCNLDILYANDVSSSLKTLFVEIFQIFPVPKLDELSAKSNYLTPVQPSILYPNFPFFNYVYNSLEKQVDLSIKTINLQSEFLDNASDTSSIDEQVQDPLLELTQAVLTDLKPHLQSPNNVVGLAFDALAKDQDLWQLYFTDFITYKLKLFEPSDYHQSDIAQQLFRAYFSQLHGKEMPGKAVELHCHANISHHFFAQMASILRSLNRIEGFATHSKQLLDVVKRSQHPLGSSIHLSNFVIKTMFSSLLSAVPLASNSENPTYDALIIWFKSYRDIMSLPTLKNYVYSSMLHIPEKDLKATPTMEAMLNIMQTTFIVLQSSPLLGEDTLINGCKTFKALLRLFVVDTTKCSESFQMKCRPGLGQVVQTALKEIICLEHLNQYSSQVKLILEGLLSHFFSADRTSYFIEDVQWFLELVNKQECLSKLDTSEEHKYEQEEDVELSAAFEVQTEDYLLHSIERSLSKYYLGRILVGKEYPTKQPAFGPLSLYNQQFRTLIGKELANSANVCSLGPYIPPFYWTGVTNTSNIFTRTPCMEQPLCHVYFFTVMEHLWSKYNIKLDTNKVNALVRLAGFIMKQMEKTSDEEAILLRIELQALIQVLCYHLADCLDPQQTQRLGDFQGYVEDLNKVLSDTSGCNGLVLSMHLLKMLKSSRKFNDLFTVTDQSTGTSNVSNIKCLESVHSNLKTPPKLTPHLFPFLHDGHQDELYCSIQQLTLAIHKGNNELSDFYQLARDNMKTDAQDSISRHYKFRMMLWLVAYYEFYERKIDSQLLSTALSGEEMSTYLHNDKGYIRLVQCFLSPNLLVRCKENPTSTYQQESKNQREQFDYLYDLFDPTKQDGLDQSDRDLRYSLANMVAVIVGSPSGSNHLWYHFFALEKLRATFMTGFLFDRYVGDIYHYDCGVEFTSDGGYGRFTYRARANQGTFTLHSLYLLLWANFGCFCMALLTLPDSHRHLLGPIISSWQPVRNYCIWELRTLWVFMQDNLGLTEEERSFYVMNAMTRFHEVFSQSPSSSTKQFGGVFETREELSAYEKMWHCEIYQPTWDNLKTKFAQFSIEHKNRLQLFNDISKLSAHYPHFPSESECIRAIMGGHVGDDDNQEVNEREKFTLLSNIAMNWQQLQVGGALLPDLVEFYAWLHKNLAHMLTFERASTICIGRVISLIEKNRGPDLGKHIRSLYESVKEKFNHYVDLIGGAIGAGACAAVHRENEITKISDEVPILHFLSDSEEENQGNDCLYTVIGDIIANHNLVLENRDLSIHRLLPECPSLIFPLEVNTSHAIIGSFSNIHGISSFLQLLRSRYRPESRDFHEAKLEEDLVSAFVAGKPQIKNPSLLRIVFQFRKDRQELVPKDAVYSSTDLDGIAKQLPESFKTPFSAELMKKYKYEFHSASYHLMTSVVMVMRTIVGYLVNFLSQGEEQTERLQEKTVKDFILELYNVTDKTEKELLIRIGFQYQNPNPDHIRSLAELPLTSIFSCLELFIHWIDEGFYDFNNLTFQFKASFSSDDEAVLEQLPEKWSGTPEDLLKQLDEFIDVLKLSEPHITSQAHETKSILEYLKEINMIDDEDLITQYIPVGINLSHYVVFRLALRRIQQEVRQKQDQKQQDEKWSDCVDDLWVKHFPNLRKMERVKHNSPIGHYVQQNVDADAIDQLAVSLDKEVEKVDLLQSSDQVEEVQQKEAGNSDNNEGILPATDSEDLPALARKYTIHDVSGFLAKIELSQYIDNFMDAEISGDVLLGGDSEMFEELEVTSHLHQMKIAHLFRKELKGSKTKYSNEHLSQFLLECKLDKYIAALKENGINGDMILEAENDLMKEVLKEIGITSSIHRNKITSKYKTFVSES